MAEITVAESAGFCFGVDRAVKLCYQALKTYPKVATLGPIIHNQSVVDDLKKNGARIVNAIAELEPDECVVIRSHGVSRSVYDQLAACGNPYVDATCPFVKKIHRLVEEKSCHVNNTHAKLTHLCFGVTANTMGTDYDNALFKCCKRL